MIWTVKQHHNTTDYCDRFLLCFRWSSVKWKSLSPRRKFREVCLFHQSNQPCGTHTDWLYYTEWCPKMSLNLTDCECDWILMSVFVLGTFWRCIWRWKTGGKTRKLSRWGTWTRNQEKLSWQKTSLWVDVRNLMSNLCHNLQYCEFCTKAQLIFL